MCGIAGRLLNHRGPIGDDMVQMLIAMRHRGYDSTGFSFYGPPRESGFVVRAHLDVAASLDTTLGTLESRLKDAQTSLVAEPTWIETPKVGDAHIRFEIGEPGHGIPRLLHAVETIDGLEVQSIGRSLEIVKDIGDAREVAERHGLFDFVGSHGLGHDRMATESKVKAAFGHPFWARPFPDVSIVHNGQLTNYFTWRRRLEREGYTFTTENDSELIAVYIARQLAQGVELSAALHRSVDELDGVFTYLIATIDQVGLAKDRLAIKPMVSVAMADGSAMATEEQALRTIHPAEGGMTLYEGPRQVKVWDVAQPAAAA